MILKMSLRDFGKCVEALQVDQVASPTTPRDGLMINPTRQCKFHFQFHLFLMRHQYHL
jgi:hypothetical protein